MEKIQDFKVPLSLLLVLGIESLPSLSGLLVSLQGCPPALTDQGPAFHVTGGSPFGLFPNPVDNAR